MNYAFANHRGYTWDDKVITALQELDQGTVIRDVPLVYAANGELPVLAQTRILEGKTGGVKLTNCDTMVTSQTCDIRGESATRVALLSVAPVYPLKAYNATAHVNGLAKTAFLAHVTGAAYSDEPYVVDLRFETAIEKSIVVDRAHVDGFATSEERAEFAKKLGEYRRRGAFDEKIEEYLLKPLAELFAQTVPDEEVYEVRVFANPDVSRATESRLIIACYQDCDVDAIRARLSEWYDDVREAHRDLVLLPLIVNTVDEIRVSEIMGSVPVYFRQLSAERPAA